MTVLFIALLLIAIICFLALRYYKTSLFMIAFTLIFLLVVGCGLFSIFLLTNLESSYAPLDQPVWEKNNAIVVLGGGNILLKNNTVKPFFVSYSRIYEAARLYSLCRKTHSECKVIISGGDPRGLGKSEALVYSQELLGVGVKASDIILESHSNNTFENAKFTSAILKSQGVHYKVFLVTSGIHMKRSLLYFSHFAVHATPAIADYITPSISIIPTGYNFAIANFTLHEYLGIIRLYVYNYFGWND